MATDSNGKWIDTNNNFSDGSYLYKNAQCNKQHDQKEKKQYPGEIINGVLGVSQNTPSFTIRHSIMDQTGIKPLDKTMYSGFSKFGYINPYDRLLDTKEVLFFTRPDLNIMEQDGSGLNTDLENIPFFVDLLDKWPNVIRELQLSYNPGITGAVNNFMYSLHNTVKDTLDLPDLSSTDIDIPQNMYGNDYTYRGSSESSDDNPSFSLEFEDTRDLDVYMLFRAYEEYERLKRLGRVAPPGQHVSYDSRSDAYPSYYVQNRILHDQICIYKFVLLEDLETIVHYSKFWGVYPKSLPRNVFGTNDFNNGLSLSIDWAGAFVEDMNPLIIQDFNTSMWQYRDYTDMSLLNKYGGTNRSWASGAFIVTEEVPSGSGRYKYKLKWRGEL